MIRPALTLLTALMGLMSLSVLVSGWVGRLGNAPVAAFSAGYDLWQVDIQRGLARQLTRDGGRAEDDQPTWSPDGQMLAFMSVRRQPFNARLPNSDLMLLEVNTGALRVLRSTPSWEDAPAWSPDGASVMFSEKGTGGGTTLLVQPTHPSGGAARTVYHEPLRNDLSAAWAPDGANVYIHGTNANGRTVVLQIDLQSGISTTVLARTAYRPKPSPDGQTLALWIPAMEGYALALWRQGMAAPAPLTTSFGNPLPFAWMPDGDLSVVIGHRLVRVDAETGTLTTLYQFEGGDLAPARIYGLAWRP